MNEPNDPAPGRAATGRSNEMPVHAASTANLQGHYAGFVSRLIAFYIDVAIISIAVLVLTWLIRASLLQFTNMDVKACPQGAYGIISRASLCWAAAWLIPLLRITFTPFYIFLFWIFAGQTPGKYAMGLRVVRADGRPMTVLVVLRRMLGYFLTLLSLGVGFAWMLIDNQRQAWHDTLAGTVVIYSWKARQDERFLDQFEATLQRRLGGKGIHQAGATTGHKTKRES